MARQKFISVKLKNGKNAVINIDAIESVVPRSNGKATVYMRHGNSEALDAARVYETSVKFGKVCDQLGVAK